MDCAERVPSAIADGHVEHRHAGARTRPTPTGGWRPRYRDPATDPWPKATTSTRPLTVGGRRGVEHLPVGRREVAFQHAYPVLVEGSTCPCPHHNPRRGPRIASAVVHGSMSLAPLHGVAPRLEEPATMVSATAPTAVPAWVDEDGPVWPANRQMEEDSSGFDQARSARGH